jgi:hypothetical protein
VRSGNLAGGAYSLLSSSDQWAIHRFYAPTDDIDDKTLRDYRRSVTKIDPSLPQRAGRAYAKLKRGEWSKVDYAVMPNGRAISVRAVVRPKPDAELLARVFWQMAMRDIEEKSKDSLTN